MLYDIKWFVTKEKGHCTYDDLSKICDVPFQTLRNLMGHSVIQPLHSTGEKILKVHEKLFPVDVYPNV